MAVAIIDSRRKRVNVESMVAFDGLTQNATVTNPNLNSGVASVSFFVNVNSSLSITKGAWSYTGTGLPLNRMVHVVIQGGRLFINSIDTAAATNFPANTDSLVFSGASLISHFCALNRTLTPAEISYIHAQGGLLPASTHAACVAHYPCTQREGNTLYDVVEQYNYAKYNNETNGSFATDTAGWSLYQAGNATGILSYNSTDKAARLEVTNGGGSTTGSVGIQQNVLVSGQPYELSYEYRVISSPNTKKFQADFGTGNRISGFVNVSAVDTAWKTRTITGTANNAQLILYVTNNPSQILAAGDIFEFRNVKLRHTTAPKIEQPYHATLQNFTAAQHTGDVQTAYKDFYTKTDLRPYVDSNNDGTPDQPLIEKASALPPLRKALRFESSAAQTMTCGNLGSIQGIRLAVKLDAVNQSLLSLDNTAATTFQVAAGSFTAGASIAGLQIYVDGHLRTAAQAGATLNDLKFHDVVMLFNAVSASNMRVTTGDKTIAALFIMSQPISRKIIVQLANNTLLAQPTSQQQAGITQLYNFNSIIDNSGTYELENLGSAGGNAVLSGYTAANLDPLDPSYALTDINSLR